MMAAAKKYYRALLFAALLAMVAPGSAFAQQTIQVATTADVRALLGQAENLLAAGDVQRAYELLEGRETELSGHAYFDYLLGVAALDTGRINEAILSLRRAAITAPQFSGARMELARAHFEAGEKNIARPIFVALLAENPPSGVRGVLDQYIAAIDARPATPASRFDPYLELIVGDDDNANGSTSDQQFLGFTLDAENLATESTFYEGGLGFNYTAPQSASFAWQFGAHGRYRQNPDASFVDSGLLSALGGVLWRSGSIFGHANVDAYWATRDGESNESYTGLNVQIGRNLNDRWDLNLTLRGGSLRYDDAIEILDVDRNLYSLGTTYRFQSRGHFGVEVIGGSDDAQQSGSPYGNSKFGGRLSINAPIGESSYVFVSLGSLTSDYDGLFFGIPREDTQLTSVLQLEFRDVLTEGLTIAPRLRYIDNDSDVSLYDYDRTEIGLMIRWMPR